MTTKVSDVYPDAGTTWLLPIWAVNFVVIFVIWGMIIPVIRNHFRKVQSLSSKLVFIPPETRCSVTIFICVMLLSLLLGLMTGLFSIVNLLKFFIGIVEVIFLYNVYIWILFHVGGGARIVTRNEECEEGPRAVFAQPPCLCCWKCVPFCKIVPGIKSMRGTRLMIMQLIYIRPLIFTVTFLLENYGAYEEGEVKADGGYVWVEVFNTFSTLVAITGMFAFLDIVGRAGFKVETRWCRPAIAAFMLLPNLQSIIITIVAGAGGFENSSSGNFDESIQVIIWTNTVRNVFLMILTPLFIRGFPPIDGETAKARLLMVVEALTEEGVPVTEEEMARKLSMASKENEEDFTSDEEEEENEPEAKRGFFSRMFGRSKGQSNASNVSSEKRSSWKNKGRDLSVVVDAPEALGMKTKTKGAGKNKENSTGENRETRAVSFADGQEPEDLKKGWFSKWKK